jgi:hypothetical protein
MDSEVIARHLDTMASILDLQSKAAQIMVELGVKRMKERPVKVEVS